MTTASINLLSSYHDLLTPEFVERAGELVGESPAATRKALDEAGPAVLGGLMNRVSTSSSGGNWLMDMLNSGGHDGSLLGNLGSLFSGGGVAQTAMNTGKSFLSTLLGTRMGSVSNLLANDTGIKQSSASSLLSLAAPLLLGLIGRQRTSQRLDGSGLMSLLAGQRDWLMRAAPAGLAGALGLSSLSDLASRFTGRTVQSVSERAVLEREATVPSRAMEAPRRRFWPLLLLALGLLALFLLFRGFSARTPSVAPVSTTFAGVYEARLASADGSSRFVTLELNRDGLATVTSDHEGTGRVVERGRWSAAGDTVTVNLDSQRTMSWTRDGDVLVPKTWDSQTYGAQGMRLTRRAN